MSFMFEVYYKAPEDAEREARILAEVLAEGGCFDYREVGGPTSRAICLTYEFAEMEQAEAAAEKLRHQGEYIEGPMWYGD